MKIILIPMFLLLTSCGDATSDKVTDALLGETEPTPEPVEQTKITPELPPEYETITYKWSFGDKHFGTYVEKTKEVEVLKGSVDCENSICELEAKTVFKVAVALTNGGAYVRNCTFDYFHDFNFVDNEPVEIVPNLVPILNAGWYKYFIMNGESSLGYGSDGHWIYFPNNDPCENGTIQ